MHALMRGKWIVESEGMLATFVLLLLFGVVGNWYVRN